jgi:YfiH family protein
MTAGLLEFAWRTPPGVCAAFTTRVGGVSAPPWDSFNIGAHVGDDTAAVVANRARLRAALALPAEPAWLEQVHGTAVSNLDAPSPARQADAAVTRERGRVAAIMVADCLPVLFASRDGSRIGAAHAGWRGLAAGVLDETVQAIGVPGAELIAWLGPAIHPPNFEVGDDVRTAFVSGDSGTQGFLAPNERGRWQADLVGIARHRLGALGVVDISGGEWCTFADRERFFSHRRDAQRAGNSGRMAALIWRA